MFSDADWSRSALAAALRLPTTLPSLLLAGFVWSATATSGWSQSSPPPVIDESEIPELLPPPQPATPADTEPPLLTPEERDRILGEPSDSRNFDTYRLGPGDTVFINVRQFPELSLQATLDIQGNIILPLQGAVSLNGLTLDEAEQLIAQVYNQYVIQPDVTLTLTAQRGVEVTILGEVVRPGFYPLGAPQISTALLTAGGTTGEADLRNVRIQRQLPNGELLESTVDLFTPLKEGVALPDVALQDGDVIVVEELDEAALDDYDRELVSQSTLARPQITVRALTYGPQGANLRAITLPNGSRFADAITNLGLDPSVSKLDEVGLVRFDAEAGRAVTTTLDGEEAFRGEVSENPPLRHNDVIVVNRTLLTRITFALNRFTQPFRDVLGFILFFDSLSESAENLFGPGGDNND